MTHDQQPEVMQMGLEIGVQSRVRHAECEWRRASRSRKRRQRLSATTAKTVWWRGNRYDVLGEDAHTLPSGGRILLRELQSRPCGTPRMMPYIRLGRYRGEVVEDHGGSTSPPSRVSGLTTREDAGGWIQVTPKPRALRYPYSVLSFDRIGRWWRTCKMLGLGQDASVRVSDPAMQTDMPRWLDRDLQWGKGLVTEAPGHDDVASCHLQPQRDGRRALAGKGCGCMPNQSDPRHGPQRDGRRALAGKGCGCVPNQSDPRHGGEPMRSRELAEPPVNSGVNSGDSRGSKPCNLVPLSPGGIVQNPGCRMSPLQGAALECSCDADRHGGPQPPLSRRHTRAAGGPRGTPTTGGTAPALAPLPRPSWLPCQSLPGLPMPSGEACHGGVPPPQPAREHHTSSRTEKQVVVEGGTMS